MAVDESAEALFSAPLPREVKQGLEQAVRDEQARLGEPVTDQDRLYLRFLLGLENDIVGGRLSLKSASRTNQLASYLLAGMSDRSLDSFLLRRVFDRSSAGDTAFISRNISLLLAPHTSPYANKAKGILNYYDVLASYVPINVHDLSTTGEEEHCFSCGNPLSAYISLMHQHIPKITFPIGITCWESLSTDLLPEEGTAELEKVKKFLEAIAEHYERTPYPKGELSPRERKRLEEIKDAMFSFTEKDVEEAVGIMHRGGASEDRLREFKDTYIELGMVLQRMRDRNDPSIGLHLLEDKKSYFNILDSEPLPGYLKPILKKAKSPIAKLSVAEQLALWDYMASQRTIKGKHYLGDLIQDLSYYDQAGMLEQYEQKKHAGIKHLISQERITFLDEYRIRMVKHDWREERKKQNLEYVTSASPDFDRLIENLNALLGAGFLWQWNGKGDQEGDEDLHDQAFVSRYLERWQIGGRKLGKDRDEIREHYLTLEPVERFRRTVERMKEIGKDIQEMPQELKGKLEAVYQLGQSPLVVRIRGFEQKKEVWRALDVVNKVGRDRLSGLAERVLKFEKDLSRMTLEGVDPLDPKWAELLDQLKGYEGYMIYAKPDAPEEFHIKNLVKELHEVQYYPPSEVERKAEEFAETVTLAEAIVAYPQIVSNLEGFAGQPRLYYEFVPGLEAYGKAQALRDSLTRAQRGEVQERTLFRQSVVAGIREAAAKLAELEEKVSHLDEQTIYPKSRGFFARYKQKNVRAQMETVGAKLEDSFRLQMIGFFKQDPKFRATKVVEDVDLSSEMFKRLQLRLLLYNEREGKDIRLMVKRYEKKES